ncbi:MAG: 4Fe-4S binding protein [Candidatus Scalindua sp.]
MASQKENSKQKSGTSKVSKKKRKSSSWMTSLRFRWISQISFFILTIYVGWMFYLFVRYCETGGVTVYVTRPPGVEAFLPIGDFMGLKYFLGTGNIDPLHPAGFIIFASILVTSILFQRGFCSWICPVGTISEWAWRFGDLIKSKFNKGVRYWLEAFPVKLTCGLSMISTPIVALLLLDMISFASFKSPNMKFIFPLMIVAIIIPFAMPRKIWPARVEDSIARAWKYTLLAFFAVNIVIKMPAEQIGLIIAKAPYMKVADIKMMKFFLTLSMLAIIILSVIFIFSVFNKNYWCRYFCPYGALIGILGWASAIRIVRNKKTCIDCSKCTVACPVYIEVEKKSIVYDVECLGCYDCVDSCPVDGALDMKLLGFGRKIHYAVYAGLVVGLFVVFMNTARVTGYWHNNVSVQEYTELVRDLDNPRFKHQQGKFELEE